MGWKCWIEERGGDVEDQGLGTVYKSRTEIKIGRKKKTPGKLNLMTKGKRKPETYKFP